MTAVSPGNCRPAFDYAAVIGRCARGDRRALHELYKRDAGAMRSLACRILGGPESAEDAVHDAFIQVWLHAGSFDTSRATGRSWLLAILRYRALNMRRSGARERLVDEDPRSDEADEGLDAEAALIVAEEIERLAACLGALRPEQREALLLSCASELSHSEVSLQMGLPLGTVKSWIARGRQTVRQGMQASLALLVGFSTLPSAIGELCL